MIVCVLITQGTVLGQSEKLAEVESALASLQASSSGRERIAMQVEAELRTKLQEAEETVSLNTCEERVNACIKGS